MLNMQKISSFFWVIFGLIFLTNCQDPKPAPQQAVKKIPVEMPPINDDIVASAILYQANIRQYTNEGTFKAFAEYLPEIKSLGVNVLWLMPVNPISTTKSKGPLGSYFAISDYTKVNPEFGTLEDFKSLVNRAHELGMYVILGWVPGHTGWDHVWLKDHPEYYLKNAKGEITDPLDPRTGKSFGWTDVADLDYSNLDMREAMRQAMLYWVKECRIDGFRIDQAYAVPQDFYEKTFAALDEVKPVFLLAETDINHPGGIELVSQFTASYDWKGHHLAKDIAHGRANISDWDEHRNWVQTRYGDDNQVLQFTANHDENSWNGTIRESFGPAANLVSALQYTSPGLPMLYTGQEYDLDKRLLFFEKDSFPKVKGETFTFLKQLGELKRSHDALKTGPDGGSYTRLNTTKNQQVIAFERGYKGDTLVFIGNMSPNYAQFTLSYTGKFKRFPDAKTKKLSPSYQYDMKPWEFWILTDKE